MTLKWILSMAIIFVILFGITIAVSADESSADVIGLDQKQYLHKPPELPAELGIKIKDNLYSSELIEGATLRSSDVIHLYEGINFVSVPMPLADGYSTVEEVFGEISPGEVLGWNGTSWFIPSEDDEIVPLDGYVIIVEEEYDISLELDPNGIPPTKNLTGVNLIGFSDVNPATARDTLYCVHEDWSEVMGYDAETQQYETSILNGGTGIHSDEREMYPTKGYWLWMDNPGTLITLNAPWADDYQFSYEDLSTIPTAETAANEQSIIAYGGMPHTNSDASYAYNRITNDSIFFFNGHGIRSRDDGEHGGGLSFWNGTDKTIIAAEHIDAPLNTTTYYIAEFNDQMNDVLLAVYVACWSGRTSAHLGNLVTMTHSKGADNVIGFTEELLNPQSNYWSDRFWYRCRAGSILGTPQTIPTAAQSAKTDVLIAFYPYTGGVSSLIGEYHSDGGVYDYLIPARYGTN